MSYSYSQPGSEKHMRLDDTKDEPSSATEEKPPSQLAVKPPVLFGSGKSASFDFKTPDSPAAPTHPMAATANPAHAPSEEPSFDPEPERREAGREELYERVAAFEAREQHLRTELTSTRTQANKLQRVNSDLRATVEKANNDSTDSQKLRELNRELVQEIRLMRLDLKAEKEANMDLVAKFDEKENHTARLETTVERLGADLSTATDALAELQRRKGSESNVSTSTVILEEVNRALEGPVLATVTHDISYGSARSLRNELRGAELEAFSEANSDDDQLADDQEMVKNGWSREMGFSEVRQILCQEPTDHPALDNEAKDQEVLRLGGDIKSNTGQEPRSSLGTAGRTRERGDSRYSTNIDWWLLIGLMYIFFIWFSVVMDPFRRSESAVWKAANEDTIGLAWMSRGRNSLWTWTIASIGRTKFSDISVGFYG